MAASSSIHPPPSIEPLVSVVVPTHNRPGLLAEALGSIVRQTYDRWEILVVNDGETPVDDIVRKSDPVGRIRLIRHRRPFGPAAARNTALRVAAGEIVAYLDDDDLFRPNHLREVVDAMRATGSPIVYTDSAYFRDRFTGGKRTLEALGNPYEHRGFHPERLLVSNHVPIQTLAHRWDILERTGMFDESMRVFEDWEFLLRLIAVHDLQHVERTTVEIRHRPDRTDNLSFLERPRWLEGYERVYRRHGDRGDVDIRAARDEMLQKLAREVMTGGASASAG